MLARKADGMMVVIAPAQDEMVLEAGLDLARVIAAVLIGAFGFEEILACEVDANHPDVLLRWEKQRDDPPIRRNQCRSRDSCAQRGGARKSCASGIQRSIRATAFRHRKQAASQSEAARS